MLTFLLNKKAVAVIAEDCFQLGKVAYDNGDYYHAIKWFDEAVRLDIAINSTVPRSLLLDYLSFSVFQVSTVYSSSIYTVSQNNCTLFVFAVT